MNFSFFLKAFSEYMLQKLSKTQKKLNFIKILVEQKEKPTNF